MDKHEISLRLQQIISMHKMNPSQYATFTGIKRSTLEGYLKESSTLKIQALEKICEKSKISADYLLFGKTFQEKQFSTEDFELLSIFHELSKEKKIKCLAYLKGFIDSENSKQNYSFNDSTEKVAGK